MPWSETERSLVRVELDQVQFIGRAFGFGSKRGMGHAGLVVVTYGRCLLVDGDMSRGRNGEGGVGSMKGLLVDCNSHTSLLAYFFRLLENCIASRPS